MCQNEVNMLSLAKSFAFVMCLSLSSSRISPEIKLEVFSICADAAEIGWFVISTDDAMEPLSNCSVTQESYEQLYKSRLYHLRESGVYKLQHKLKGGDQYRYWIKCGDVVSNTVSFTALDNCTSAENSTSPHVDVYYQEQSGFLFGSRDSVLGILFGLFGLMIILVTSYYLWRRYRTRQRRQRIRSYLGASLIDPFTNLQNRMTEIETRGGQRLMESSDSL